MVTEYKIENEDGLDIPCAKRRTTSLVENWNSQGKRKVGRSKQSRKWSAVSEAQATGMF